MVILNTKTYDITLNLPGFIIPVLLDAIHERVKAKQRQASGPWSCKASRVQCQEDIATLQNIIAQFRDHPSLSDSTLKIHANYHGVLTALRPIKNKPTLFKAFLEGEKFDLNLNQSTLRVTIRDYVPGTHVRFLHKETYVNHIVPQWP